MTVVVDLGLLSGCGVKGVGRGEFFEIIELVGEVKLWMGILVVHSTNRKLAHHFII